MSSSQNQLRVNLFENPLTNLYNEPILQLIYNQCRNLFPEDSPQNWTLQLFLRVNDNKCTFSLSATSYALDNPAMIVFAIGDSLLDAKQNLLTNFHTFVQTRANEIFDAYNKEIKKYNEVLEELEKTK